MNNDLEQKIAERKKQAEERQIAGKAHFIAKKIGESSPNYVATGDGLKLIGDNYLFENKKIGIHADYNNYILILSSKKFVFQQSSKGAVELYIPGSWEQTLEKLYQQALQKEEDAKKQKQEEYHTREREERAKWGL